MPHTSHHKAYKMSKGHIPFRDISPRDIFFYFQDLAKRRYNHEELRANWNMMRGKNFDPQSLDIILDRVAKHIPPKAKPDFKTFLTERKGITIWTNNALKVIDRFDSFHLSSSLCSFAEIGIRPDTEFMEAWTEQAENILDEFTGRELSISMWALAMLGLSPEKELLQKLNKEIEKKRFEFNAEEQSLLLWSAASLSAATKEPIYARMAGMVLNAALDEKGFYKNSYSNSEKIRLQYALNWFDFPVENSSLIIDEDRPFRARLRHYFDNSSIPIAKGEEAFIPELAYEADIRLNNNDRELIITAEDRAHFITDMTDNSISLDGDSSLRNALLSKLYPESTIISFRYFDEKELRKEYKGHQIAPMLVESFSKAAAGIYETRVEADLELKLIQVNYPRNIFD